MDNEVQRIASAVADHFSVSVDDLKGKSRKDHLVRPRHLAFYLIRSRVKTESNVTIEQFRKRPIIEIPYQAIGDYFGGRNHSTVRAAVLKTEWEVNYNYGTTAKDIEKIQTNTIKL